MKKYIKFIAILAGFLASMPMTSAWASSTTYYAALKASVSNTGGGKVYAGTSKTAGTYASTSTSEASSTTQNESKTFYAFAQADEGFEFAGWSKTDKGTDLGTASPLEVKLSCNSTTSPNATTYYATFKKKVLDAFGITFEKSDAGTYTVDGAAPANKTGLTEATMVKLASSDPNFLNWKVNGKDVFDNPYTATCIADTTISAEFLTADMVAEVATFDELTAALANKKKITIPADTEIAILAGEKLTIPAGTQLVINGTLAVVGNLEAQGVVAGAGKVLKIVKSITQSDPITPQNSHTSYPGKKYCKTTVSSVSSAVSGTVSCASGWGVVLNDTRLFEISAQDPYALNVSFSSDVINQITNISGVQTSDNTTANSGNFLLLKNWKINNATYSGIVDCGGGNTLDYPSADDYHKNFTVVNGKVTHSSSSGNFKNGTITCINCTSCEIHCCWNTPNFYFYDCGTAAEPATIKFMYRNSSGNKDLSDACDKAKQKAYFYSGYFNYSFSANNDKDVGNSYVYGGSFSNDPTDKSIIEPGFEIDSSSGRYVLVKSAPKPDVVKIGTQAYKTLQAAVNAAESGARLNLIQALELDGQLTIDSDKQLTIDLCGFNLSGGSIVNEGKLRFEDTNPSDTKGTMSVPVTNNENGTIDITYGNYSGTITLNGGALTTHNGTFASTFSVVENGGAWQLKGGKYTCQITLPEGYMKYESGYVGETVKGLIKFDKPISSAEFSYTIEALEDTEYSLPLYRKYRKGTTSRESYSDTEWDRIAEMRSSVGQVESKYIEATIVFDRAIKKNSFAGIAMLSGQIKEMSLDSDLKPNEDYRLFIPLILYYNYTPKGYSFMFNGGEECVWEKLYCGGKNSSLDNIGTTCTLKFQLRTQVRSADYTTQNQHHDYEFYADIATYSYKFSGKGAIYGDTDYTSLATAIEKVAEGGTIRLSKDCTENVTVGKETSFTLDMNNFEFTGTITAAEGFKVKQTGNEWKIYSTVVEVPLADGEESKIAIEIDEELEKRAEEEEKSVAEVLNEVDANGVKVWENQLLKAAPAESVTKKVVQEVKNEEGEIVEKAVDTTKDLPTGIYIEKTTVPVQSDDGKTVEHTVEVKTARIQNDASADSVMVAVAGDTTKDNQPLTVANVIAAAEDGDVIQVYDKDRDTYLKWTHNEGVWIPSTTYGQDGKEVKAGNPEERGLKAGEVFWYQRAEKSDKPITTEAVLKKDVKVEVEQGEANDKAWTMVPNLKVNDQGEAEGLDLDEVKDENDQKPFANDQVVVPMEGTSQRTYTFKNNQWGYNETKSVTIGGRTLPQTKRIENGKLPANKNFWWVSGGGKPKIILNESKK